MPPLKTTLTALPVGIGDAFLLQAQGKAVLVDGGQSKEGILDLLRPKLSPSHIDILICTHYDTDHYAGILALIQARAFTISEVWLPEILGNISYSIRKDYQVGLKALRSLADKDGYRPSSGDSSMAFENQEGAYPGESVPESSFEDAMRSPENPYYNNYYHFLYYIQHYEEINLDSIGETERRMFSGFFLIQHLVSTIYHQGVCIRWFKYQKVDELVAIKNSPLPFFAANCWQTELHYVRNPGVLLEMLYKTVLTPINRESLNFLFRRDDYPDIFFTGDSNLSYRSVPISLTDGSIVTAPHHGAASAENAYPLITGSNLQFIRSDSTTLSRPCRTYKELPEKYCTVCQNKRPKKEVVFNYSKKEKAFITISDKCCCE